MRPSILSAFLIAEWRNPGGACAIADNPWCARYYKEGAPTSCYFTSYQQVQGDGVRRGRALLRKPVLSFVAGGGAPPPPLI
jgi:hypothetical protein